MRVAINEQNQMSRDSGKVLVLAKEGVNMLRRKNIVLVTVVFVAVLVTLGAAAPAKDSVLRAPDKLLLGQEHVEQLLLLMDADKSGKISKKEWMDYMNAEFDRLDKDKRGELDVKEIRARLRVSHFANMGK